MHMRLAHINIEDDRWSATHPIFISIISNILHFHRRLCGDKKWLLPKLWTVAMLIFPFDPWHPVKVAERFSRLVCDQVKSANNWYTTYSACYFLARRFVDHFLRTWPSVFCSQLQWFRPYILSVQLVIMLAQAIPTSMNNLHANWMRCRHLD